MSNTISREYLEAMLDGADISVATVGRKTTVVQVTLPSGWEMIESSACVDPDNYSKDTGKKMCMEKITDRLWELEGYRLQCQFVDEGSNSRAADAVDATTEGHDSNWRGHMHDIRNRCLQIEKYARASRASLQFGCEGEEVQPHREDEIVRHYDLLIGALEDARMRCGKVLQWLADGVSIYDKRKEG